MAGRSIATNARRWFTSIVACLAVVTGSASSRGADTPAAPDFSTPTAAVASFAKALAAGDAATLSVATAGDAKERDWVLAQGAQLKAFLELEAALTKKFGKEYAESDAGQEIRQQIEAARDDDLQTDLSHAKLGPPRDGVVLILLDEAAPDDRQGRLVKEDGKWKVEVASLVDYYSADAIPVLRASAEAATSLTRDVTAAKFATLEDAATAVDERLAAPESTEPKQPAPAQPKPAKK